MPRPRQNPNQPTLKHSARRHSLADEQRLPFIIGSFLVLIATTSLAFPQAHTQRPPNPSQTDPAHRTTVYVVRQQTRWITLGGFGFGGSSRADCRPPNLRKVLDKDGPQLPDQFLTSDFSIRAYTKGGWPMFIDYELEEAAVVLLSIAADDADVPFYFHLDGTPGRHQVALTVPERFSELKPGVYTLRALSDAVGEVRPVYLRLFGIGAGPRAVGSLRIDQLRFSPGEINTRHGQQAEYSFRSQEYFTKAEAEFWLVGRLGAGGPVTSQRMAVKKIGDSVRAEEIVQRRWNGKVKKAPDVGQYQLQVCAWVKYRDGGDWAMALSGELVTVRR